MYALFSRLAAVLAVILLSSAAAAAQKPDDKPAPTETYVDFSGFKNRIFEVHHRDPLSLLSVLGGLGSGFRGATIVPSREFGTLTIRDFPANLAVIEEAIQRLDVPSPPRSDVEISLYLLVASEETGAGQALPAHLQPVVAALRPTVGNNNLRLVATTLQRTREGSEAVGGRGMANVTIAPETRPSDVWYTFGCNAITVSGDKPNARSISLTRFDFELTGALGNAGIRSNLSLVAGTPVVVARTGVKGGDLILVASARVLE